MTVVPTILACLAFAQASPTQEPKWLTFQDPQKAVSVEFPDFGSLQKHAPFRSLNSSNSSAGAPILEGAFTRNRNSSFVLVYCDLPKDADPVTFLPKTYDDHVAKVKWARQVERKSGEWNGCPAYEGAFLIGTEEREVTARVRLVVLGNRLFQQYSQWKSSSMEDKILVDRFFESLRL